MKICSFYILKCVDKGDVTWIMLIIMLIIQSYIGLNMICIFNKSNKSIYQNIAYTFHLKNNIDKCDYKIRESEDEKIDVRNQKLEKQIEPRKYASKTFSIVSKCCRIKKRTFLQVQFVQNCIFNLDYLHNEFGKNQRQIDDFSFIFKKSNSEANATKSFSRQIFL